MQHGDDNGKSAAHIWYVRYITGTAFVSLSAPQTKTSTDPMYTGKSVSRLTTPQSGHEVNKRQESARRHQNIYVLPSWMSKGRPDSLRNIKNVANKERTVKT
jgi:hypothetical protein